MNQAKAILSAAILIACGICASDRAMAAPAGKIIGWIDGVYGPPGAPYIQGWACETNNPNPIDIHVYTDGSSGSANGKFYKLVKANQGAAESGINNECGTANSTSGKRFFIPVTADFYLRAGQGIWIHGICPDGCTNELLRASGSYSVPQPTVLGDFSLAKGPGPVGGWAFDNTASSSSITVKLFAGGNADHGHLIASIPAADYRGDVNAAFGIQGNHGFNGSISENFSYGLNKVYAYAQSIDGALVPLARPGGVIVASGGTDSVGGPGMKDMATPQNTAQYRAAGGKLYIHEMGWLSSTEDERKAIAGLFPDAPIFETSSPQALGSVRANVLPYWSAGASVVCVQKDGDNTLPYPASEVASLRQQLGTATKYLGVTYTPNSRGDWRTSFWDPSFDWFRDALRAGGAYCVDAPPYYYFAQEPSYRDWIANSITWATQNGIVVVGLIFPAQTSDLWSDTQRYVQDLQMRDAVPGIWAFDGYYGSKDVLHPIGSETDPNSSMYSALKLLRFYPNLSGN